MYLLSLALIGTLACKTAEQTDDGDQPATPLEVDDAAAVLAEQICSAVYDCNCPNNIELYVDEADCVASLTNEFAQNIDSVIAEGGTWDPECAGELAKTMRDWGCLGQTGAMRETSFSPVMCPVLKGSRGVGNDCWRTSLGDDCQAGLLCVGGTCTEAPPLPLELGQQCLYGDDLPCAPGLYCEWDENYEYRFCQEAPVAGDACNGEGYYECGPESNDLICETNVCTPAPGQGESCEEWFLCSPGLYCDGGKDFTCQPRQELGEGCGGDPVCPVDASCINSICTADPAAVCYAHNLFMY